MNLGPSLIEKDVGVEGIHLFGALSMISTFIYVLSRYGTTYPIELVILVVAFVSYLMLSSLPRNLWLTVRYYDWFITVPLLVYVVSQFGSRPYWMLAAPVLLMLGAGFMAVLGPEVNYKTYINWGFVFFAVFFLLLITSENTLPWPLVWIFFGSWVLYGFVDRLKGPQDHWAYTLLDVFNKPIFIISLLAVIG